MIIAVGDILIMRKAHPCGNNRFLVLRVGMDFKLKCQNCGREFIIPRIKVEKNIKQILESK